MRLPHTGHIGYSIPVTWATQIFTSSAVSLSVAIPFPHPAVEPRISFDETTVHWTVLSVAVDTFRTVDDGIPLLNLFNFVNDDFVPPWATVRVGAVLLTISTPFKGLLVFLDFFHGEYRRCYSFPYKPPPGKLFGYHFFHEFHCFSCIHQAPLLHPHK